MELNSRHVCFAGLLRGHAANNFLKGFFFDCGAVRLAPIFPHKKMRADIGPYSLEHLIALFENGIEAFVPATLLPGTRLEFHPQEVKLRSASEQLVLHAGNSMGVPAAQQRVRLTAALPDGPPRLRVSRRDGHGNRQSSQ